MNGTALATTPAMSPADKAAHAAASYVRPIPTPADLASHAKADAALDRLLNVLAPDIDAAKANWIPNVAPEPEDMVAIDAYGTRVWPMTLPSAA